MIALALLLAGLAQAPADVAPVRTEVRMDGSSPTLYINGARDFPFAYLAAAGDLDKQYKQFADLGGRFFTLTGDLGNRAQGFDGPAADAAFLQVLRQQPQALMFPRVDVSAPGWWLEQHPDERVVFDDGSVGPQSMFSEAWLDAACRWVEEYVRHVRNSPYRDRVIGIHPCTGYTAEWQSWGLWDNLRGDFSPAAERAWRVYLRAKYGTDEKLSEAWGHPERIDHAKIPTRARREGQSEFLRPVPQWQDVADFYDFYGRQPAKAIRAIAAAAKRAGGPDFLVGFFYGYLAQYGGKMQESQHLGLRDLLDCPDIDFFCSPAMYSDRGPGGTSTFMSMTDSMKLHGKFWWDEADNRTHLADNNLAQAKNVEESLNVLEREFAHAFTEKTGIWWFDMSGGWYDDPALLSRLGEFRRLGESHASKWDPPVEVAVVVDDKSAYRNPPDAPYLNEMVSFFAALPRLGAPYHTYLLSDLPRVPAHRLYVFPNAFDLADDERQAIEALKRDGRTLVFFGPAGIGRYEGGSVKQDPALAEALTGVATPAEPWQRFGNVRVSASSNPPLERLREAVRDAGIHVYTDANDAFYAGNGFVALHAGAEGPRKLVFPAPVRLREVFPEGDTREETEFELPFKAFETRSFTVEPAE